MSLGPAIGLVGLGLMARAMFCPSEPEKHRIDDPEWTYCPHCGRKLVKEKTGA